MILIQEYYESDVINHANDERSFEIKKALSLNIANEDITHIYLFTEQNYEYLINLEKVSQIIIGKRATFRDVINHAVIEFSSQFNEIIIISNNDISIKSNQIDILKYFEIDINVCLALSRYDNGKFSHRPDSQDTWIFKGPIKIPANFLQNFDFYFGLNGSDNRLAYLLKQSGFKLINTPEIITIHHHKSIKRPIKETVAGPYYFVEIFFLIN